MGAKTLGSDIVTLLDPYLAASSLHVVGTSSRDMYSRHFETVTALQSRFDRVMVKEESSASILLFARARMAELERIQGVFFTAGALMAVRDSVLRFSPDLIIDATDDLLEESAAAAKAMSAKAAAARSKGQRVVTREIVLREMESRTGVPLTDMKEGEKSKLANLEERLHGRIVGQEEAINAISKALRRARAGVSSQNRPIGSFLFLGPTGVGKTETTKALSEIFFGIDAPMVRFDMSEYNEDSALTRLIGSFETGMPGKLSSAMRESEYGVVLLDEFEKTDKRVIDLFLQVFDEGIFSDAFGKKVSVRNHIFVATSNAGSDMIFNIVKSGENLMEKKDEIIQAIIDRNIFKPELLNRFDGAILFHPLSLEHLRKIARLMLGGLNRRLKGKGIELAINDEVIEFLVSQGQDPKFGARPLNRAIQDHIESLIATRLIEGSIKPGDLITFTREDLKL